MNSGISVRAVLLALAPLAFSFSVRAADPPAVVASIAPVHSLAAAVMAGAGRPALLVPPGASPHTLALKPSEAALLRHADLVFWIGPELERFLRRPLAELKLDARALAAAPGVDLLAAREGGFKPSGPGALMDMHIWLDPANARAMARAIAAALAERDPARAALYTANARTVDAALTALEKELAAALAPIADRPFVVLHDAYQYLEWRFGLKAVGAVMADGERLPGAGQTTALHARARDQGVTCVFAEPQFSPRAVAAVAESIGAKTGVLDPLGQGLDPGPDLYAGMMRGLAKSLISCLKN